MSTAHIIHTHLTHYTKPTRRQSIGEKGTAQTAWEKSCYFKIDFKIPEDAMMYEAVQRCVIQCCRWGKGWCIYVRV